MSDHLDMSDLLEVFFEEADEQLLHLEEGVLALEKNAEDLGLINEIFRAAHTLKGSSASMGFTQIADLTHKMETLMDKLRSGDLKVTQRAVDSLLKGVDVLRVLVECVRSGEKPDVPLDETIAALQAATNASVEEPQSAAVEATASSPTLLPKEGLQISARISADCVMPAVRAYMVFSVLEGKGEVLGSDPNQKDMDHLASGGVLKVSFRPSVPKEQIVAVLGSISEIEAEVSEEAGLQSSQDRPEKAVDAQKAEPDQHARAMQTVRVGVDRLDNLMNLVGELVIDRTRIGQVEGSLSSRYEGDNLIGGLGEASLHLGRVINELQEQIMKIRMLPVDQVFNRFPRMVRDLAQKAGKKVNFVITGQETELDRSILEDIVDPITHLLRNSIDHGIEKPEDRVKAGKPEVATVRLAAKHEENRIVIEVEDDGRGISAESVKEAAIKRGVVTQEAADRMSDKDKLQLMLIPGVSTAKTITDISGRGVGMDVVKSNIERLSGTLDINTELGEGTRIGLRLPLTLAIVQALITSVDNRIFAIPLTAVVETSRCRISEIRTIEARPVLQFRDSVLPLVDLDEVFPSRRVHQKKRDKEKVVVIVRASGQQIGITVDSLIGEQEVVIKSLGSYFGQVDGISGAALLGDGGIALIADVPSLPAMLERKTALNAA